MVGGARNVHARPAPRPDRRQRGGQLLGGGAAAPTPPRVESAVPTAMPNLETQLGVALWDRSTKIARLTEQGHAVVAAARKVCAEVDGLRQLAAGMVAGLEASVSLCVDMLFPVPALVALCKQ